MKRQVQYRRRLRTLRTLSDAVGAMKSLSAHHFRMVRASLPAARDYRRQIERIAAEVGMFQPLSPQAPPGVLVIASDLGLCGDYNTRLARAAADHVRQHGPGPLRCVGRRAHTALRHSDLSVQHVYTAPTSLAGLPRLLLQLAQDLLDDCAARRMGSLTIVSARFEGAGRFAPVTTTVLPVQPVRGAGVYAPTPYLSRQYVAAVVVREYLYTTLHEVLLDALAAEYGMRLVSTESADQWLELNMQSVQRQWIAARREAATQEVLSIAVGRRPQAP